MKKAKTFMNADANTAIRVCGVGTLAGLLLLSVVVGHVDAVQLNVLSLSSGAYDDVTLYASSTDTASAVTLTVGSSSNTVNDGRAFMAFIVNDSFHTVTSGSINLYLGTKEVYCTGADIYQLTPGAIPGFAYSMTAATIGNIFPSSASEGTYHARTVIPTVGTNFFGARAGAEGYTATSSSLSSRQGQQPPFLSVTGTLKSGMNVSAISAGTFDDISFRQDTTAYPVDATTLTAAHGADPGDNRAYLAFAVPQRAMVKALLFLYYNRSSSDVYGDAFLYRVTPPPSAWSRDLAVDPSYRLILNGAPGSGWYALDVTSWIAVGATNYFSIRGVEGYYDTGKAFDSSEGPNAPYLWLQNPIPQGTSLTIR